MKFLAFCESKMLLGGLLVTDLLLKIFDCVLLINTINSN